MRGSFPPPARASCDNHVTGCGHFSSSCGLRAGARRLRLVHRVSAHARAAPGDLTTALLGLPPPKKPAEVGRTRARSGQSARSRSSGRRGRPCGEARLGGSFLSTGRSRACLVRRRSTPRSLPSWRSSSLRPAASSLGSSSGGGVRAGSEWRFAAVGRLSRSRHSSPHFVFVFIAARTGILPPAACPDHAGDLPGPPLAYLAWHIPLPALALALPIAATFERLQSQAMTEVVGQPFVAAARARGVAAPRTDLAPRLAGVAAADLRRARGRHRGRCSRGRSSSNMSRPGLALAG